MLWKLQRSYLNRVIYCGEHQFGDKCKVNFPQAMEQIIDKVNAEYCLDQLTGLLLLYPNYFVHLIDVIIYCKRSIIDSIRFDSIVYPVCPFVFQGSEDSLTKHFRLLLDEYKQYLGRMKILVVYNHSNLVSRKGERLEEAARGGALICFCICAFSVFLVRGGIG